MRTQVTQQLNSFDVPILTYNNISKKLFIYLFVIELQAMFPAKSINLLEYGEQNMSTKSEECK